MIPRQRRAAGRGPGTAGRVARPRCKTPKQVVTRAVECTVGVPLDLERGTVSSDAAKARWKHGRRSAKQLQLASDEQQKAAKFMQSCVACQSCSQPTLRWPLGNLFRVAPICSGVAHLAGRGRRRSPLFLSPTSCRTVLQNQPGLDGSGPFHRGLTDMKERDSG